MKETKILGRELPLKEIEGVIKRDFEQVSGVDPGHGMKS